MAEEQEAATTLYPAWREALKKFDDRGFATGDLITHEWLWDAFGMVPPEHDAPHYLAERAEAAYRREVQSLIEYLLTERQIAFENVYGQGYRYVMPGQQTEWAEREANHGLKRELGKGFCRMSNVQLEALSAEQRRANADGLARLARLGGMVEAEISRKALE